MAESGAIGFIANGSILPRASGGSDKPADTNNAGVPVVSFKSPPSLEVAFTTPHQLPGEHDTESESKTIIKGMLIKEGITVITGGGFQGKTTLLRALASDANSRCVRCMYRRHQIYGAGIGDVAHTLCIRAGQ